MGSRSFYSRKVLLGAINDCKVPHSHSTLRRHFSNTSRLFLVEDINLCDLGSHLYILYPCRSTDAYIPPHLYISAPWNSTTPSATCSTIIPGALLFSMTLSNSLRARLYGAGARHDLLKTQMLRPGQLKLSLETQVVSSNPIVTQSASVWHVNVIVNRQRAELKHILVLDVVEIPHRQLLTLLHSLRWLSVQAVCTGDRVVVVVV